MPFWFYPQIINHVLLQLSDRRGLARLGTYFNYLLREQWSFLGWQSFYFSIFNLLENFLSHPIHVLMEFREWWCHFDIQIAFAGSAEP